jgi:hypothetical protein
MGIYQESLERALEYMGLSMNKDQVVNASIDGEAIKRALIPSHVLNAAMWHDKYQSRCISRRHRKYAVCMCIFFSARVAQPLCRVMIRTHFT